MVLASQMTARVQDRPQLRLNTARISDIGLEAWQRPDDQPRAPLAVVCLAGNPAQQFGSSHAKAPLIAAVVQAMREIRVPVVSFDYKGVGMSAPGGPNSDPKSWHIPSDQEAVESVRTIIDLTKEHISDKIVLCGYSFGASHALREALMGCEHAYISLSHGFNVFKFFTDKAQIENLKRDMENNAQLTCKALYVIGERDRMTPIEEAERLTKARSDGGAGASIEILKNGTHDLKGLESIAADKCAEFVTDLQAALVGTAAEKSDPVPETTEASADAVGAAAAEATPASTPEIFYDFRVTCLKCEPGSVFDSFHVTLPDSATVGNLRAVLGAALLPGAQVCELDGMGFKVLKEDDALPPWITIDEFKGVIGVEMVMTTSQCQEAQGMMKEALQKPAVQKKLDQLEKDAKGNDTRYRMLLTKMLNDDVYPDIVSNFNLPEGVKGSQLMLGCIPARSDVGMIATWLELETLMRNKAMIKRAQDALYSYVAAAGPSAGA